MTRGIPFLFLFCLAVRGEIIAPSNTWDFAVGVNIGVRGGMNLGRNNLIDATAAPYNTDNTGATSAKAGIEAALAAAVSNDVVYLPPGTYNIFTNGLVFNHPGVTLRGAGTNTWLQGNIVWGPSVLSPSQQTTFVVTNGGGKGTTNLVLTSFTDQFAQTLAAGDMLQISAYENDTNDFFQVISRAGRRRIITQMVTVHSRSGSTVSISSPLIWSFTNNPQLVTQTQLGSSGSRPRGHMGMENLRISGTNFAGKATTAAYTIRMSSLRDCWASNIVSDYCLNYAMGVAGCVYVQIDSSDFHHGIDPLGTSRSGLLFSDVTGALMQNNIVRDLGLGWQFTDAGVSGNAFFGNFSTNCTGNGDFLVHGAHPIHNLFEANHFGNAVVVDGYFGSAGPMIFFRNRNLGAFTFKRNVTHMQVVGNWMGSAAFSWIYTTEANPAGGPPYASFSMGYPHIGNDGYTGINGPVSWNFPGNVSAFRVNNEIADGIFTYTNPICTITNDQLNTNIIWGAFATIPRQYEEGYPIRFQDPLNTNKWWPDDGTVVLTTTNGGTSSNMSLVSSATTQAPLFISVSNGWKAFIWGQNAFDQLQSSNKLTHNLHGNRVLTNAGGTVVWNDSNADHAVPDSLLYPSGAPGFWTVQWPGVDFTTSTEPTYWNEAQKRYYTAGLSTPGTSAKTGQGRTKNKGPRGRFFQP